MRLFESFNGICMMSKNYKENKNQKLKILTFILKIIGKIKIN